MILNFYHFYYISAVIIFATFIGLDASVITGLRNHGNSCYLNALLSCLYDAVPFRTATYLSFHSSAMSSAMASVFARKQLNALPVLNVDKDMMKVISEKIPTWRFGVYQDIEELFKLMSNHFAPTLTDSIGFQMKQIVSTTLENLNEQYLINEGRVEYYNMINLQLPELASSRASKKMMRSSLILQEMIDQVLIEGEIRPYSIYRDEHPEYFDTLHIPLHISKKDIQAIVRLQVLAYADVIPVFIPRRQYKSHQSITSHRKDRISIDEVLNLPTEDGGLQPYHLISFAVYQSGHYYAYGRGPETSGHWTCYNDSEVSMSPSASDLRDKLETQAVLLFYTRTRTLHLPPPEIPEKLKNWSLRTIMVQHMKQKLMKKIQHIMK